MKYLTVNGKLLKTTDGITTAPLSSGSKKIPLLVGSQTTPYDITAEDLRGAKSIVPYAFATKTGLRSVEIPEGVTFIGQLAFAVCPNLVSITIPSSVSTIGYSAFAQCNNLREVHVADIRKWCEMQFYEDANPFENETGADLYLNDVLITDLVIPEGTKYITNHAFRYCRSITSVTIPESLIGIGSYAFEGCENLKEVHITSLEKWCEIDFGDSGANPLCNGADLYLNGELVTDLIIPEGTTSIGRMFMGCSSLRSVSIPSSITSSSSGAFRNCDNLMNITLAEGITRIPDQMFYGCSSLTDITIPNSVTYIGTGAFQHSGLTSITIPDSVTNIESYAFDSCDNLREATIPVSLTLHIDKSNLEIVTLTGEGDVGNSEFYECTNLTSINISGNIVGIDTGAFYGCSNLVNLTISNNVQHIGDVAFFECQSLTQIIIPESVTDIGHRAFKNCTSLTDIKIPDNVKSIGQSAFEGCNSLESITLPSADGHSYNTFSTLFGGTSNIPGALKEVIITGGTDIGSSAFSGCSSLTSISIPESVINIGSSAFSGCSGLTSITILNSVSSIGKGAFEGCSGLTSITIPFVGASKDGTGNKHFGYIFGATSCSENSLKVPSSLKEVIITGGTNIGNSAFYSCSNLTNITLPDSVTSIDHFAFSNCSNLTDVIISDNITRIGRDAFENTPWYNNKEDGAVYISKVLYKYKGEMPENTNLIIQNGIKSISPYALASRSNLTTVTIPDTLEYVGDSAFDVCNKLTAVHITDMTQWCKISFTPYYYNSNRSSNPLYYAENLYLNGELVTDLVLPSDITEISSYAFHCCNSLTSIAVNEGVTTIGLYAFSNCSNLERVTIPSSLRGISDSAFYNCNKLNDVYITDLAKWCEINFAYGSSNPLCYAHNLYLNDELITNLDIPSSITYIGKFAFYKYANLTNVNIPNTITAVGEYAFYECCNLTNLIIPDSVISIGREAFQGCIELTDVALGSNIQTIDYSVFANCDKLVTVHIPDLVKWLSISFKSSLPCAYDLYVNGTVVTDAVIPNIITDIKDHAFDNCRSLRNITIPDTIKNIGAYAFAHCVALESVVIPGSVSKIDVHAFDGCSAMTSMVISNGVKSIGAGVFYRCSSLTSITIPASVTFIGRYRGYSEDSGNIFKGCTNLTSIIVESGNTTYQSISNCLIEKASKTLLAGCKTSIIANSISITRIDTCAFSGCTGLTSVTIPNKTISIGQYAFRDCSDLISITIPNSVTSIGEGVFRGCSGLKSITITGNTAIDIGYNAFNGCSNLKAVYITDIAKWCRISFSSDDYANPLFYAHNLYLNGELIKDLVIPDDITSINTRAFMNCNKINRVTIGRNVTSIGNRAFYGCQKLIEVYNKSSLNIIAGNSNYGYVGYYAKNIYTPSSGQSKLAFDTDFVIYDSNTVVEYIGNASTVILSNSITNIHDYAFSGCNSLTSITIPNNVMSIGDSAFANCSNLTSIIIPNNVTNIHDYAFYKCSSLTTVNWNATACTYAGSYNYPIFNGCTNLTTINIGDNVTAIPAYAFYGCNELNAVYITDLVKWCAISFGNGSSNPGSANPLSYAHNLYLNGVLVTDLVIPDSVMSISNNAFNDCNNLTSVTISNAVTSIGSETFQGCNSLTSITIGNNVTSIGDSAFNGCESLATVNWNATACTYAGRPYNYDYIFNGCSNLTLINIGNNVTSIPNYAFYGCTGLTSINIPVNVISIGNYSVYIGNSTNKATITMKSETPPTITYDTFNRSYLNQIIIPKDSLSNYQAATYWNQLNNYLMEATA